MEHVADHLFNPKSASPALREAVAHLALQLGRTEAAMTGMRLGELFEHAQNIHGDSLPEFWRVWQSWNLADDTPAEWGDL